MSSPCFPLLWLLLPRPAQGLAGETTEAMGEAGYARGALCRAGLPFSAAVAPARGLSLLALQPL